MGLISDITGEVTGALGFEIPGLSGLESLESFFADPFKTRVAVEALRRAGRIEEANQLENRALVERILKETAGARERADIAGAELLKRATQPLAESEEFQRDVREGLVQQRLTLGAFGLGEGTTFERAAGETTARAISKERTGQANLLSFLAGGAETGIPGALGAQGLVTQSALARAQTEAGIGQVKMAGRAAEVQTLTDILGTAGIVAAFA